MVSVIVGCRNILGHPADVPVVRPYGDWIDRAHLFSSRDTVEAGDECFGTASVTRADASLCRSANAIAVRTRDVARLVVTERLQQRLREALR